MKKLREPRDFWLGGFDAKTNTWLAFPDPVESMKPKLVHVREVGVGVGPKTEKKDEEFDSKCKVCHRKALPNDLFCLSHQSVKRHL